MVVYQILEVGLILRGILYQFLKDVQTKSRKIALPLLPSCLQNIRTVSTLLPLVRADTPNCSNVNVFTTKCLNVRIWTPFPPYLKNV